MTCKHEVIIWLEIYQ